MSIFIDDGKRFQAVDVIYFRSKTFNVGVFGGSGSLFRSVVFFSTFSPLVDAPFWEVFPRRHREGFFMDCGAILESFGRLCVTF